MIKEALETEKGPDNSNRVGDWKMYNALKPIILQVKNKVKKENNP